jgi:chaperonin GroES
MAKDQSNSLLSKIKPTAGYVLIEPEQQQTQTTGGIYLPETAKGDKPQQGKVLAVGGNISQDGKTIYSPAEKDATVIYKKWGGNEVKIDSKEYLFVKFEDILAVIS